MRPPRLGRRGLPSLVAAVLVLVAVPVIAWRSGGYFPSDHLWLGAVAAVAAAVLFAVRADGWRLGRTSGVAFGALVAYALFGLLSTSWSLDGARGADAANLDLVYVAVFGLALLAAGTTRVARLLPWGVLVVLAIVVGGGLVARLLPDVLHEDPAQRVISGYRLAYPLGYWNAFGLVAAMAIVLGVGLSANPRTRPWNRGLALAIAVLATPAEFLSLSRGGWLVAGIGIVVLLGLAVHRRAVIGSLVLYVPAGAVCVLAVNARALTTDPTAGAGQHHAGATAAPLVLAVVVAAGVARALAGWALARSGIEFSRDRLPRPGREIALGAAAAVVVLAIAIAAAGLTVNGRPTAAYADIGDFTSTQWREFSGVSPTSSGGTKRLGSVRGTRSDVYRVALDGFEAHPLWGDGAGSFRTRYYEDRHVDQDLVNAHSLYLETLSDRGLLGFVPLAVLVGAGAFAIGRARRRRGRLARSDVAAVGAACAAWLVHAGLDWDWQVPATTVPVLVLLATVLVWREAGRRGATPKRASEAAAAPRTEAAVPAR